MCKKIRLSLLIILFLAVWGHAAPGIFEGHGDVGVVKHKSAVSFDSEKETYTITTAGKNVWDTTDAFHFVWKKVSGDFTITADVELLGEGTNAHRKAGLMARQSLDANSPYADAVIHGSGLASLQYRIDQDANTLDKGKETGSLSGPLTIQLNRKGDTFTMLMARKGKSLEEIGKYLVPLRNPVYLGLILCSHEDEIQETAVFSNVIIETPNQLAREGAEKMSEPILESTLETINIETGQRKTIYSAKRHFEAPNWSRDGQSLIFNSNGKIYKIGINGGEPNCIDTGDAIHCNNDHGLSPDGRYLVISNNEEAGSTIYIVPSNGGTPRKITEQRPSYWHGWSPDGQTLAYCAERNGNYDIYTIFISGGPETRLTNAVGLDDGPDYSPEGKYIYINSERTGVMKIWRMKADGSEQTQITTNQEYADWFPHPSPDGKWIVFLSYDKSVKGHPANKDVVLRIMSTDGGGPRVLTKLFGGQGTINVPSWSPDSKEFAFVSYRLIEK
jgi:TolB protein